MNEECAHEIKARNVFGEWICLACKMIVSKKNVN